MDKYNELKGQVYFELNCELDLLRKRGIDIPENLDHEKFLDLRNKLDPYNGGILFAYLSIVSKIDKIDKIDKFYLENKG